MSVHWYSMQKFMLLRAARGMLFWFWRTAKPPLEKNLTSEAEKHIFCKKSLWTDIQASVKQNEKLYSVMQLTCLLSKRVRYDAKLILFIYFETGNTFPHGYNYSGKISARENLTSGVFGCQSALFTKWRRLFWSLNLKLYCIKTLFREVCMHFQGAAGQVTYKRVRRRAFVHWHT